jgi:hypothetical protein
MTTNAVKNVVQTADESANEQTDESIIENEVGTALSDELDRLHWTVFEDISNIQV